MKMELEWTNDTVIRLVEEYKARPQLWDANHAMYRASRFKYESWGEMATIFDLEIADVRKKLNSLLASHRREKARVRSGVRSTWFLYPHLSFLPSHVHDGSSEETVLPDDDNKAALHILNDSLGVGASSEDQDDGSDQDDEMEVLREEIIIKDEPEIEITRQPIKRHRPVLASRSKMKQLAVKRLRPIKRTIPARERETTQPMESRQSEGIVAEVLRLLRRAEHKKKDSCDSFGEYIADSLRKHDEKTQAMIKQAINNIIFEQEMQKYKKNNEFTVVISGREANPLVLENSDDDKKY